MAKRPTRRAKSPAARSKTPRSRTRRPSLIVTLAVFADVIAPTLRRGEHHGETEQSSFIDSSSP